MKNNAQKVLEKISKRFKQEMGQEIPSTLEYVIEQALEAQRKEFEEIIGKDELESPIVKPKRGRPRKYGSGVSVTKIYLSPQARNEFRKELRLKLQKDSVKEVPQEGEK